MSSAPAAPPGRPPSMGEVGPYHLESFIAAGAMGAVWRARHGRLGHAVAVKVIGREFAHDKRFRDALRREVQAMAGLRHAGIAVVLDHGIIEEGSAHVARGSPYVVMELARGGTLSDAITRGLDWAATRAVLLAVLDALAHAHARDVIHRDLKPDNLLDFATPGAPARWKLVDFGIAHSAEGVERGDGLQGTPAYMAPEQFLGRWRDFGPGTDLYALGCVAHEMLCGQRLFTGKTVPELAHQHLEMALPPFTPRVPVPVGLEAWLHRLLARHVGDRFPYAADAAASLRRLGPATVLPSASATPRAPLMAVTTSPTDAMAATAAGTLDAVSMGATMGETIAGPADLLTGLGTGVGGDTFTNAVVPAELAATFTRDAGRFAAPPDRFDVWRESFTDATADALAASSIRLFGLRAAPFVGRDAERRSAWDALARVRASGRPEALILEGAAGAGKSRLAEWIAHRVAELGAAQVLRATHDRDGGQSSGLGPMLMRHHGCVGLTAAQIRHRTLWLTRLAHGDDGWDLDALAELMLGSADDGGDGRVDGRTAGERFGGLRKYLQIIGRERPVLMWLDDAHWSEEAVALVRFVLRWSAREACPVLFLLTVRSEDLEFVPTMRALLDEVAALPRAERLRLAPLSGDDMQALIGGRLHVDGELADRIVQRSHGNPLFVVQLLREWVGQGLLRPTADGFEVPDGVEMILPTDLHAVWNARIEHLLAGRPVGDRAAIGLAAVLGLRVDRAEWQRACEAAHVVGSEALVAAMVEQGLAKWTEAGFAFAHGLLRESLVRRARELDWASLNRSCATALASLDDPRSRGRLGRHLLEAGALRPAIAPLLDAIRSAYAHAEVDEAFDLLARCARAVDALGTPPDAAVAMWTLQGRICSNLGRREEAAACLERARQSAEAAGLTAQYAEALLVSAHHCRTWHASEAAARLAQAALSLFETLGDRAGAGWSRVNLAHVLSNSPEAAATAAHYTAALQDFEALGDRVGMAQCQRGLGWLRQAAGDADAAAGLFAQAYDNLSVSGHRLLALAVANDIADLHRAAGDLVAAEAEYRRVLDVFESVGHVNRSVVKLNLGMVKLERGEYGDAEALARQLLVDVAEDPYLSVAAHAQLLVCAAARRDATAWARHFTPVAAGLDDAPEVELDDAITVDMAAHVAHARGLSTEAAAAARIGKALWKRLGKEDRLAALAPILAD